YVGFDAVIGNPPYIQLQKAYNDTMKYADLYKTMRYETFDRTGDIYCLFYEKGIQIAKDNGLLCYISSNKWMRAGYGEKLRNFFLKYNPLLLLDLGPGIFESATVDTCIMMLQKSKIKDKYFLQAVTITKEKNLPLDIDEQVKGKSVTLSKLTKDAWFIGSEAEQKLKEKIERLGKPLKDWDVKIYYGIKTGFNEAFIIDNTKRQEILDNCKDEDERRRTEAIIKPILRGRDIKRYYYEWAGLWVIGTFPALHLNIDEYPAIKKYLLDHFDIRQLEQSGKKYPELGFNARKKTRNKWFETQDQIAYYPEFEKEKVVYPNMSMELQATYDANNMLCNQKAFIITGFNLKYIIALFNSKMEFWYFRKIGAMLGSSGYEMSKIFIRNLPLPPITQSNQSIVSQIESLVDKILAAKKENHAADTSEWEKDIDELVYKLYDLTEEEIAIVERRQE
ncbi:MAG TPA: TaqI-like C-terminal specificity domain-containing protein, partial [Candidatus Pacearchaeota archaeon]|nr:TaqI-like C-terminal specificity domain-containing protein [Candidatus Pacearchaeota archaeon]